MKAQRLPGKPLLKLNGLSIISHVVKRAKETQIGEVIVATEDDEIIEDVKKNNGEAILTSKGHKSGTDRIWEAYKKLNIKNIDFIINLQGDEPLINVEDIRNLDFITKQNTSKITTLASKIDSEDILLNKNIVKAQTEGDLEENKSSKAIDFFRKKGEIEKKNIYHHIGIYCYSKDCLEKFVHLNQSKNEIENRLEQLRALDNNIDINVSLANSSPIGVDTEEDYLALKKIMEYKN